MKGIIYIIKNKINGKVYIGQTTYSLSQRISAHKTKAFRQNVKYPLYNSMRKYGINNFEWNILKESNNTDEDECFYIEKFNSIVEGYNIKNGGNNALHSEETKLKLSKIAKERFKNIENHPMYGKKLSKETKKKISDSISKIIKGDGNPFYGRKHTEESKEKIRKARMKQTNIGNKEWKFLSPNDEKIIINNLKDFCKENSLSYIAMKMCKYGKQKQHRGWRYVK